MSQDNPFQNGWGAVFDVDNQLLMMILLSVSFVFAGIGIFFFVSSGIVWASFEKLLQEGDYSKVKKKESIWKDFFFFFYEQRIKKSDKRICNSLS